LCLMDEVVRESDDQLLFYWPSYDMVTYMLGPDAYQPDRRHISQPMIRRVMQVFDKAFVKPPSENSAAFLMATTNRPRLLEAALKHLRSQEVPKGWGMSILVGGEADDPGRKVAEATPGVRYVVVPEGSTVTDKLNACLLETSATIVLEADDDDLQVPGRLAAAVRAYELGADWSGSSAMWFVDLLSGKTAHWVGTPAARGLIGTSLSFKREILERVGGWPKASKNKDAQLKKKLAAVPGVKYVDLTSELCGTVGLQHGANIKSRPFPRRGDTTKVGKFRVEGRGPLVGASLPDAVKETAKGLHESAASV